MDDGLLSKSVRPNISKAPSLRSFAALYNIEEILELLLLFSYIEFDKWILTKDFVNVFFCLPSLSLHLYFSLTFLLKMFNENAVSNVVLISLEFVVDLFTCVAVWCA